MSLYSEWIEAKEAERMATEHRRFIEDQLTAELGIDEAAEGSKSLKRDGYKIKVTQRINRRVNGDLLQEIAAENGLTEHLSALFRWSPSIDAKAWKGAAEDITRPLEAAITATPGRPSYSIEIIAEEV